MQICPWHRVTSALVLASSSLPSAVSRLGATPAYSSVRRLSRLYAAIAFASIALPSLAHAQVPNLGSAANFAVLAGSTATNTGPSVLEGSLGVSPGSAVTGFPPGMVVAPGGIFVGNAVALQAQIDLAIGYNQAASRPATADLSGQNLGGLTLTPGVYNFTSVAQLNGVLTLNALGNPNAVFIFNIGSTLNTGSASSVTMIGGGLGSNVYWRVGSSATLGTTTAFTGDILALTSITLNTGANITCGSALARNGAVTLDTNNISIGSLPACAMAALIPTPAGPALGVTGAGGVLAAINTAFASAFGPGGSGTFPAGFLALAGLPPGLQAVALQELAGEQSTAVAPSGILAMNSFLSVVLNPYAGAPFADNRAGFGPAPPGVIVKTLGYAPDQRMPNRAPAYGSIDRAIATADFDPRRWSIWGAAYGDQSRIGGDLGTHDLTARTYGLAAGVDYRVLPNTIVGFSLGGGATNFGLSDGLGGGRMDMFQAAIYSSTRIGAAYISAALAYGWYDTTTNQTLSFLNMDRLTAHFVANDIGGRIEGGYRFAVPVIPSAPDIGVTPYAAVQAQAFHTPSYSEDATSDFARSFGASTTTAIRTELGSWVDQAYRLNTDTTLILRGRAAWAHDFVSNRLINVGFVALPGSAFTEQGAMLPRDLALVTAGAEIRWRNGVSVAAQFDGEFAEHAFQYGGTGRVRYSW
jgi:outer membrane autotransporter protein